jgi:peptide/nickel transport system substrate-binding protein
MKSSSLIESLKRTRTIAPLERLGAYVNSLSLGDRVIAGVFAALLVASSAASAYALERTFLIAEPAYGGTLTEGVVGSPRFVNPLLALSDTDRDLVALVYAGLMGEDGGGNLIPVLAESYAVSEDGKNYTFVLRADAVFSDGSPVTADDVVFTVEKAQDPALKSPEYANWSGVSVAAVDPRTVEFTLAKAYAPFLENATLGILPSNLWRDISNDEFPFSELNTEPVGAGPFKVSDVARDADNIIEEYELSANSSYALGRPYLDGIRFVFFGDSSDLAEAVREGDVESAYGIQGTGGLRAPLSRVFGVFFNSAENPVFARLEVRKALSLAVNRERIVRDVLGGYATPLIGPVPPGSGVEDIPIPSSDNRIEAAAAVLTDAGWEYDGETREWVLPDSDAKIVLTLKTSNVPELKAVAAAVQEDWTELGIPVAVELYEPGDLTQNVIRPRRYEALLFGMVIGRDRDLYAFWDSAERNDPGLNIALYTNKTVDELLESSRAENDPAKVTENLSRVNALIAADYPAAFTHAPDFLYLIPPDLHGVRLPQITAPKDRFADAARWYRKTQEVWPFLAGSK